MTAETLTHCETMTETEQVLVEMVAQSTGQPANTTANWTELGVDSLSMAELVMEVEDHFHVTLDARVFSVGSIAEMARFLDELRSAA